MRDAFSNSTYNFDKNEIIGSDQNNDNCGAENIFLNSLGYQLIRSSVCVALEILLLHFDMLTVLCFKMDGNNFHPPESRMC